jgi:hypothetical protein
LDKLPQLLQYFIPGFVAVSIFRKASLLRHQQWEFMTVWSIAISTVIIPFVDLIIKLFPKFEPTMVVLCFYYTMFGSLFAVIASKIFMSQRFSKVLKLLNHNSPHDNALIDLVDINHGTYAMAYLKSADIAYAGTIAYCEENLNNPKIVLENYILVNPFTREQIADDPPESILKSNNKIIISLNDVDRIALLSAPESKTAK